MPLLPEPGTYAGAGSVTLLGKDQRPVPIDVSLQILRERRAVKLSGQYNFGFGQRPARFSVRIAGALVIDGPGHVSVSDDQYGELEGFVGPENGHAVAVVARADRAIVTTQRWDRALQDNCFTVTGIVLLPESQGAQYCITIGPSDSRQAKLNVVGLGRSR